MIGSRFFKERFSCALSNKFSRCCCYVPIYTDLSALYTILKETNKANVLIAICFALVGIAIYLATNAALSMIYLSNQYTTATTDAQRTVYETVAQMLFTIAQENGSIIGWVSRMQQV